RIRRTNTPSRRNWVENAAVSNRATFERIIRVGNLPGRLDARDRDQRRPRQRPDHLRGSAGFSRCHRGRGDIRPKPLPPCGAIMRAALERRRALATERVERRLTAILAADVAGYSRLTGLDEEGTHAQLQDHLRSVVDPKIAEHRGRVVKNTGDG